MEINATYSPFGLSHSQSVKRAWHEAVAHTVNGWGLVSTESHRVTAVQGDHLVHFAPISADFANPLALDVESREEILNFATSWCERNPKLVCRDVVFDELRQDAQRTIARIKSLRSRRSKAESLQDKLSFDRDVRLAGDRLSAQRRRIFDAEDAIDLAIGQGVCSPFDEFADIYPGASAALGALIAACAHVDLVAI